MAWGDYPNAIRNLDGYIQLAKEEELSPIEFDNCVDACKQCWKELENCTPKINNPREGMLKPSEVKIVVDEALDNRDQETDPLKYLFSPESDEYVLREENHLYGKLVIGCLAVKNGNYSGQNLDEYFESLIP